MRYLLVSVLLCTVAACGRVVPSTVAQLEALSPVDTDPAILALALDLPAGQSVRPEFAALILGAKRADTGSETSHRAALVTDADPGALTAQPGGNLIAMRIAPSDIEPLRAVQAEIRRWQAEAPDSTKGSLAIALQGCTTGDGPAKDARASVWIRLEADGSFQPLLRDAPLARAFDLLDTGPCAAAAPKH